MTSVVEVVLFFSSKAVLHMRFHSQCDKTVHIDYEDSFMTSFYKVLQISFQKIPMKNFFLL